MPYSQISVEPPCRPLSPVALRRSVSIERSVSPIPATGAFAEAQAFASERRTVAAGADLVSEFDSCNSLFIVLEGWFALKRILEDGRQQILDFVLPGGVIGDPSGRTRVMGHSVTALTDSAVAAIPQSRLPELFRKSPATAMSLMHGAHNALSRAYDSLTDVGRRSAREAVASFLLRMERRIRNDVGVRADGSLEFPLTQENIGDALGLTAVHVCRTLRALSKEGVVSACRKGLVVSDAERLADIAGAEPEWDEEEAPRYAVA
jgi:CRP/FNR family transcriptional regulator